MKYHVWRVLIWKYNFLFNYKIVFIFDFKAKKNNYSSSLLILICQLVYFFQNFEDMAVWMDRRSPIPAKIVAKSTIIIAAWQDTLSMNVELIQNFSVQFVPTRRSINQVLILISMAGTWNDLMNSTRWMEMIQLLTQNSIALGFKKQKIPSQP